MEKPLVLIVEDEETIANVLKNILQYSGYRTECAVSGEDALARMKEISPDVVVLDLMLPGIGGWDVCAKIRAKPDTQELPIIIYTTLSHASSVRKGDEFRVYKYISKDQDIMEVVKAVERLFKKDL